MPEFLWREGFMEKTEGSVGHRPPCDRPNMSPLTLLWTRLRELQFEGSGSTPLPASTPPIQLLQITATID